MAETNLNKILQKQGDFLGRKFKQVKNYTDTQKTEAVKEAKQYTDEKTKETKAYTDTAIKNLVNGAPEAMDTLKEIVDYVTNHEGEFDAYKAHRHDNATQAKDGFMSKEDKKYVDSIGTYDEFVAAFNSAVGPDSIFYEK